MNARAQIANHPCFSAEAAGRFGRVHLPIAAGCNMQCNYCNRKHDCVNESRPGVTSAVLTPKQAVAYLEKVVKVDPRITVAGIAGPGDAFALPNETMVTLEMVREKFPDILLCIASNGLNVTEYAEDLARLNVSHVTLTVNAVDPEIGSKIYAWVRPGKRPYRGLEAAQVLLERQLDAIEALKKHGVIVKVNTIVIPGVNDHHVVDVAERMAGMGVDILNCMPMHPTAGTPFEDIEELDREFMHMLRKHAATYISQMSHCRRCRADAVGLLCESKSQAMTDLLTECVKPSGGDRPCVAVASREGMLVNQHLGEASEFWVFEKNDGDFELRARRKAPESGGGESRWLMLASLLSDCRAVLVNAAGDAPKRVLSQEGVEVIEADGFIGDCLDKVYRGVKIKATPKMKTCCKGGAGGGCV